MKNYKRDTEKEGVVISFKVVHPHFSEGTEETDVKYRSG
jgi:hypothetical protein